VAVTLRLTTGKRLFKKDNAFIRRLFAPDCAGQFLP
jgi:hypothetical protein